MSEFFYELELVWRSRQKGDDGRTPCDYLDFLIDGESLGDLLKVGDSVGCLGWGRPEYEGKLLEELLGGRLPGADNGRDNRMLLYVCGECGDIDCGAYTAKVEKVKDGFVWKDFGYLWLDLERDPCYVIDADKFKNVGPFHFREEEYRKVLMGRPASRWRPD